MIGAILLLLPALSDRPPVWELELFPSHTITLHERGRATNYLIYLNCRAAFYSGDPAGRYEVLADAKWRYDCWDWLHWAHIQPERGARQDSLIVLRKLLGAEDYYAGRMPSAP